MLDDVQRSRPKAVQHGLATEENQRRLGQLPVADREQEATVHIIESADRLVEDHPARRVQQQARKGQPLLLVEPQLSVPAVRTVERGHKVAEIDPLERGTHNRIIETAGVGGVGHGGTQRAERQIGLLRHEHHGLARRQLDRADAPRPHAREGPEQRALARARFAEDLDALTRFDLDPGLVERDARVGQRDPQILEHELV